MLIGMIMWSVMCFDEACIELLAYARLNVNLLIKKNKNIMVVKF